MAAIQDAEYVKLCARLASAMSISLASARRHVDQAAAKDGKRDIASRRAKAEELLESLAGNDCSSQRETLNTLLSASEGDANFMLED